MVKEVEVEDKEGDEEDLQKNLSLSLALEDLHRESRMLVFVDSSCKEDATKETSVTNGIQENANSSNKGNANSVTNVFSNTRVNQPHQHPAAKLVQEEVQTQRNKLQKPKLKPKPNPVVRRMRRSRRRRRNLLLQRVYWQ